MKKFIDMEDKILKIQDIRLISRRDSENCLFLKKNKICSYNIFIYYEKEEEDITIEYDDKKTRDEYYDKLKKELCD